MSTPEEIDARFATLVGELRLGEPTAGPELRERARAIAARGSEPPARRRRLPRRGLAFVLVPVAAGLAAAVGVGVFSSADTPSTHPLAAQHSLPIQAQRESAPRLVPGKLGSSGSSSVSPATPAPSGSRAQLYGVDLRLRVSDLSARTKRAINLTRGWGGYVVSVDYGSGAASGTASLVLRVPIGKVQTAVAGLSSLGTILADHVRVQDVQPQLDRRYARMQALRAQITKLLGKLADPSLTASRRAFFKAAVAERAAALVNLQREQAAQQTRTSFATVSLSLQTKKAAAVPPSKPGRIGTALHEIGRVLVVEAEVLLWIVLVGAPFAVLALLLWASRRTLRRRSQERLLAR